VRPALYLLAIFALAAVVPSDALRDLAATAASTLFESLPYLAAGVVLARFSRIRTFDLGAYLGCGCTSGPGARSLPAAAAAWLLFGPFVALARVAAATACALILRHRHAHAEHAHASVSILGDLATLLPTSIVATIALHGAATSRMPHAPIAQASIGALLGFFAAPCAIGGVALAGALRVHTPIASIAVLCIAGILDARALFTRRSSPVGHDAFAYALLATACALVAMRHGDMLVHPLLTVPLWLCAAACAYAAVRFRSERARTMWVAPALMLAGALAAAPPPVYHATETTLTDAFPGERLTFTGALARDGDVETLVRYAITCCRADATPVAVRLARSVSYTDGSWLRIDGTLNERDGKIVLAPDRIRRIAPPLDPFVYR
jgi:hypothetical protein